MGCVGKTSSCVRMGRSPFTCSFMHGDGESVAVYGVSGLRDIMDEPGWVMFDAVRNNGS
jgi:hypothetical protein